MPKGGGRIGAGRKPLPVALHVARGSYREDRHGPLPATVLPMPAAPPPEWRPAAEDIAALGPRARGWLTAVQALYQLNVVEGAMLLAAMRSLTRVEQLETAIAATGLAASHKLHTALSREERTFLSLWSALRFDRADRS